jgi:hypothetical protein
MVDFKKFNNWKKSFLIGFRDTYIIKLVIFLVINWNKKDNEIKILRIRIFIFIFYDKCYEN